MIEISIFWFQIHITNGQNSMHRKWYTGNHYRGFLQKFGCAVIWNYFRLKWKSSPIYLAHKKSRPRFTDLSRPNKSRQYWDAISVKLADNIQMTVSIDGKSILTLDYSTLQKVHKSNGPQISDHKGYGSVASKSKSNLYFDHRKDDLNIR